MKGYMYILECCNGKYYTGSTNDLILRVEQHQRGEGANFTRKNLPVELVYFEEYRRVDLAFYREKQVQGWSRKKKQALINGRRDLLPILSLRKGQSLDDFKRYKKNHKRNFGRMTRTYPLIE